MGKEYHLLSDHHCGFVWAMLLTGIISSCAYWLLLAKPCGHCAATHPTDCCALTLPKRLSKRLSKPLSKRLSQQRSKWLLALVPPRAGGCPTQSSDDSDGSRHGRGSERPRCAARRVRRSAHVDGVPQSIGGHQQAREPEAPGEEEAQRIPAGLGPRLATTGALVQYNLDARVHVHEIRREHHGGKVGHSDVATHELSQQFLPATTVRSCNGGFGG